MFLARLLSLPSAFTTFKDNDEPSEPVAIEDGSVTLTSEQFCWAEFELTLQNPGVSGIREERSRYRSFQLYTRTQDLVADGDSSGRSLLEGVYYHFVKVISLKEQAKAIWGEERCLDLLVHLTALQNAWDFHLENPLIYTTHEEVGDGDLDIIAILGLFRKAVSKGVLPNTSNLDELAANVIQEIVKLTADTSNEQRYVH